MIITIDTDDQSVEIYNEETKDWDKGWLRSYQFSASIDSLITMDLEIALPSGAHP